MLDISDFPTRHPYTLALTQYHIERILAGWIDELAVSVMRGREVTGLSQTEGGVTVRLADGETLHGRYVVGADGGRSVVRKAAGIDFPGWEASTSALIAEVEVTQDLPELTYDAAGIHGMTYMEDGRTVRIVSSETDLGATTEPSLADLSANLTAVFGSDFGVHDPCRARSRSCSGSGRSDSGPEHTAGCWPACSGWGPGRGQCPVHCVMR